MSRAIFRNILITSVFLYWMFSTNVESLETSSCKEMSREQAKRIVKTTETQLVREINEHMFEILMTNGPISSEMINQFQNNYVDHVEEILFGNDLTRYYNCTERSLYNKYYKLLKLDFPHIKRACADKISCAVVYHYNLMQRIENYPKNASSNLQLSSNNASSVRHYPVIEECSELTSEQIEGFNLTHSNIYNSSEQFLRLLYHHTHEYNPQNLKIVKKHFEKFRIDFFNDFKNLLLGYITKHYTCKDFTAHIFTHLKKDFPNIEVRCANKIHCLLMYYYKIAEDNINAERRARPNHKEG